VKTLTRLSIFVTLCSFLRANPISLSFIPSVQSAQIGQSVTVDIFLAGLTPPPAVGAFDIGVSFDGAILSPTAFTFSAFLGRPDAFEVLTSLAFMPGLVDFAAVSLLPSAELDPLQPASFSLGTLSFAVIGAGTSPLTFSQTTVDDSFGAKLPVEPTGGGITGIPEPAGILIFGSGLAGIILWRQRWGEKHGHSLCKKQQAVAHVVGRFNEGENVPAIASGGTGSTAELDRDLPGGCSGVRAACHAVNK